MHESESEPEDCQQAPDDEFKRLTLELASRTQRDVAGPSDFGSMTE